MANSPTITDADREAAWPYRPPCYTDADRQKWDAGVYDMCGVIRAFARHREQAVAEKDAEIARLREVLNRIANARTAMDGGSIQECRVIARKALEGRSDA